MASIQTSDALTFSVPKECFTYARLHTHVDLTLKLMLLLIERHVSMHLLHFVIVRRTEDALNPDNYAINLTHREDSH